MNLVPTASPVGHLFSVKIAKELGISEASVQATSQLLQDGSTVPFIARYRKEQTGQLDEVHIRQIEERVAYLAELEARREVILTSVKELGKLDARLASSIQRAETKAALEDLYLPFKPKRRTRGMIAKERGLGALADLIWNGAPDAPSEIAQTFVNVAQEIKDAPSALAGARDIVAEALAERAEIRAFVRARMSEEAIVVSEVAPEFKDKPSKFEQYYAFEEGVKTIPSHRYLALRRGEKEGVLRLKLKLEKDPLIAYITEQARGPKQGLWAQEMSRAADQAYVRLLAPSVETDIRLELKSRSDLAAVDIFASNLRHLLMQAPAGQKSVVAIDPGARSGCKCVALTARGQYQGTMTFFLVGHAREQEEGKAALISFLQHHLPQVVAIGNGTFGREAEAFVRGTLSSLAQNKSPQNLSEPPQVVMVSEAGASVYSASEIAREEFPALDLTLRGAISIGRRLQDPLAELVKIEPKAIGVGQYQHDVHQPLLGRRLDEVVESCVNFVGVELQTASAALLAYVAGIGKTLARKIIAAREARGGFACRSDLLEVGGMGQKTYEQAAGFLRIAKGSQPLDNSGVHPERYALVEKMAEDLGLTTDQLVGHADAIRRIELERYVSESVGMPTLVDIREELLKPGRDPREAFVAHAFREGVTEPKHLKQGMDFAGIVTNVTAFGAFVDIGVHQDGLVHISQLSQTFVKDVRSVVKVGQVLQVWVHEVDLVRKRIALSALGAPRADADTRRSAETRGANAHPPQKRRASPRGRNESAKEAGATPLRHNPFAALRLQS